MEVEGKVEVEVEGGEAEQLVSREDYSLEVEELF